MRERILIVGGYGQVGRYVTLKLLGALPYTIVVAGRSPEKAVGFAKECDNAFEIMKFDVYDKDAFPKALENTRAVVMCLTPKNNDFAKCCAQSGVHYIDISPSNDVAQTVKRFNQAAIDSRCTCVLGVGIAPGLSNLLVKELAGHADELHDVRISLLLGVGEQHGEDGVKWLLDNINRNYTVKTAGGEESVAPFIKKTKAAFPEPLGKRTAYRFNLADQFIVPQTLGVDSAVSYFCYDSKFATKFVSILKRLGVFSLLRFKTAYRVMLKSFKLALSLMRGLHMGTDIYGVQIDAHGIKNGGEIPCHIGVKGNNNSLLTAHIAAFVAVKLCAGAQPSGVFYLEELFSLDDINSEAGLLCEFHKNVRELL